MKIHGRTTKQSMSCDEPRLVFERRARLETDLVNRVAIWQHLGKRRSERRLEAAFEFAERRVCRCAGEARELVRYLPLCEALRVPWRVLVGGRCKIY